MSVCCLLLLPLVVSGQVARPGASRGNSASPQYPCGPIDDAEKADVLVEAQHVPATEVLPEEDWPKLNPAELCQVWLIRLTNRGKLPAAFEAYPQGGGIDTPFPMPTVSFWLEGPEGRKGVPVVGGQHGRLDPQSPAGMYWNGVSLPKPLVGNENVSHLARWLATTTTVFALTEVLRHGPNTLQLREFNRGAVQGGEGPITFPETQPSWLWTGPWPGLRQEHIRSPLWAGCSVWGYVLFQTNAPIENAEVCCDLGKAVTWCVVERPDLADDILQKEAQ